MILHYLPEIIIAFFAMGTFALFLLAFITRKVIIMTPAMTAMVQALADLQTAFAALEQRVAAHMAPVVPAMPADDEAAATAATATMTTLKGQVEALAPAPAPAA